VKKIINFLLSARFVKKDGKNGSVTKWYFPYKNMCKFSNIKTYFSGQRIIVTKVYFYHDPIWGQSACSFQILHQDFYSYEQRYQCITWYWDFFRDKWDFYAVPTCSFFGTKFVPFLKNSKRGQKSLCSQCKIILFDLLPLWCKLKKWKNPEKFLPSIFIFGHFSFFKNVHFQKLTQLFFLGFFIFLLDENMKKRVSHKVVFSRRFCLHIQ